MLSDKEILRLAIETHYEFLSQYLIEAKFDSLILDKFSKIAEKVDYIKEMLDRGELEKIKQIDIPLVTVHGEPDRIYFCKTLMKKILKKLSKQKQKDFIRALVLHELYHGTYKVEKRNKNIYGFLRSNSESNNEFKKENRDLFKLLNEVKRKLKYK